MVEMTRMRAEDAAKFVNLEKMREEFNTLITLIQQHETHLGPDATLVQNLKCTIWNCVNLVFQLSAGHETSVAEQFEESIDCFERAGELLDSMADDKTSLLKQAAVALARQRVVG